MKLVINRCFGGFSLSRKAVARLAELQGRQCFFFTHGKNANGEIDLNVFAPAAPPKGEMDLWWTAYDIPNPAEVFGTRDWREMTFEQREANNVLIRSHMIDSRPDDRADPMLVQVVEELGEEADGACAKLAVIEIPDGIEYVIQEYDGRETIAEKHRSWS